MAEDAIDAATDEPGETTPEQRDEEEHQSFALLFELDNLAAGRRRITYDVLKGLLDDSNTDLTPSVFSRYCLKPTADQYLEELLDVLGRKRLSKDKLAGEISDGVRLSMEDSGVKLKAELAGLFQKTGDANVHVGALTMLDEEAGQRLLERLGLADMQIQLLPSSPGGRNFPTADVWLKLAKLLGASRGSCTVVATCHTSCKAALSAGMRCVVVPDEFTAFQDFGGADLVVDTFDSAAVEDVMEIVTFVPQ